MKKFFRLVMVFVLTGATLAYTGCADYSKDLDELSNRIDKLETGSIKSVEAQIESLKSTVASLETAKAVAENAIKSLQDENSLTRSNVDALKGELATLKAELAKATANGATKDEVYALVSQISSLETEITRLKDQLAKAATQDEVAALAAKIDAGEKALAALNESLAKQIAAINTSLEGKATVEQVAELVKQITALETELKTMVTLETYEAKVAELEALIAEAKNMIPTEDVETLKNDMASVISFVMKADEWILNTSYTLGQILADIDLLNETVDALIEAKMQMDEAITNLNSQVESNSEVLGVVADQLKGVLADVHTALKDIEAIKEACKNFDTALVDLSGRIDAVELLIGGIQTDVKNIWDAIAEIENSGYITESDLRRKGYATEAYVGNALKDYATSKDLKDATDALWDALKGYATQAMLKANYVTKDELSVYLKEADITKFGYQTADQVNTLINNALAGRYSNENIDKQVKALQDQIDAIKKRLDTAEDRLDVAEADIATLASRIQSIAYVPDYAQGAYNQVVTLGVDEEGDPVELINFTEATFKVYPSECAGIFAAAMLDEEVASRVKVFTTAELKAADCEEIPAANFKIEEVDTDKGLVIVTVYNVDLEKKAIALGFEASVKSESGVETGSFITSDFAQVWTSTTIELLDAYVYAYEDEDGELVEFHTPAVNQMVDWDKWNSKYYPFENCDVYLKIDGEILPISEVENMYHLEAGVLAPVYDKNPGYETDNSDIFTVVIGNSANEMYVTGNSDEMSEYVNSWVKVTPKYLTNDGQVIASLSQSTKYVVDYRHINYTLSNPNAYEWSYDFAKSHSTLNPGVSAEYLNKELNDGPHHFMPQDLTQEEWLRISALPETDSYSCNQISYLATDVFEIDYRQSSYGPEAIVTILPGYYGFDDDVISVFEYVKTYYDSETETKYVFTHEATFGPAPESFTGENSIVLPDVDLKFNMQGNLFSEYKSPNTPIEILYGSVKGFTAAELKAAIADEWNNLTADGLLWKKTIVSNKVKYVDTPLTDYCKEKTYLNVQPGTQTHNDLISSRKGQFISLGTSRMQAAGMRFEDDYISLDYTVDSWWGATYTFKINKVNVKLPNNRLELAPYFTKDGAIEAQGRKVSGHWEIDNVRLANYIRVTGSKLDDSRLKLTVKFYPAPAEEQPEFASNTPKTSSDNNTFTDTEVFAVNYSTDAYQIDDAYLFWGDGTNDYTDNIVKYYAELILTDSAPTPNTYSIQTLPFKVYTKPMVNVAYEALSLTRNGQIKVDANLWEGLQVWGNDSNDTAVEANVNYEEIELDEETTVRNFTKPAAYDFRANAKNKYNLTCDWASASEVTGRTSAGPLTWAEINANFDLTNIANGVVTLKETAAVSYDYIELTVPCKIGYDRDCNYDGSYNVNAVVRFNKTNN